MESFYGEQQFVLQSALDEMLAKVTLIRSYCKMQGQHDPIEHCEGRIKSEESMLEKLSRRGLKPTLENALGEITDAIGIRVICGFVDDVFHVAELFRSMESLTIIEEKDYISNPKPNGYRSYHMIVKLTVDMPKCRIELPAEVQIRTIAQDSWAALEHQLKYKHDIENVELIQKELKRCADEMASTDLSMQTVRQMINGDI